MSEFIHDTHNLTKENQVLKAKLERLQVSHEAMIEVMLDLHDETKAKLDKTIKCLERIEKEPTPEGVFAQEVLTEIKDMK